MSAIASFPLFSELPSEIRVQIWRLYLLQPRTVEIKCLKKARVTGIRYIQQYFSPTRLPAPFHICRESRFEAISIYKRPYFETEHAKATIWVNFELDTIRVKDNILVYLEDLELSSVRSMIVDVGDYMSFWGYNEENILRFTAIEELELVLMLGGMVNSWSRDRLAHLKGDIEEEREKNPEWRCPNVKLWEAETGKLLGTTDGTGVWK